MFFANDPYHIDETVDYKGDGMESQFVANPTSCKRVGPLQRGWSGTRLFL